MIVRLSSLSMAYDRDPAEEIPRAIAERLGDDAGRLVSYRVARRSVDARKRPVRIVYSVDATISGEDPPDVPNAAPPPIEEDLSVEPGGPPLEAPPVVIGAGPAGLFAGLLLAEHGYRPLVIDRGGTVEERERAIERLARDRKPDPECNALFGLGGAGTFSDGKLTTSSSHPWTAAVLRVLVSCGAPGDILVDAKPHVGTDRLREIVPRLAARIEEAGGEVRTGTRADGIAVSRGRLAGIDTARGRLDTPAAVLATGHSSRDTWASLAATGASIEPKPFQIGVRVEHPQEWVDRAQHGDAAGHPALGAADLRLATRVGGTPVFTFCVCPGGATIPTVNEPGHLVMNGMSRAARDGAFLSSGIVVTMSPADRGETDPWAWIALQRLVEARCFHAGGGRYGAPAQRLVDLARSEESAGKLPDTSYPLEIRFAPLHDILPAPVSSPLREGLATFDRKMRGFLHPAALALAPESRASSPVRIARDPSTRQCTGIAGLYPAGEGAGWAGGIVSAAVDGLISASRIIEGRSPPP